METDYKKKRISENRIKRILDRRKNNKLRYYLSNYISYLLPNIFFRSRLKTKLVTTNEFNETYVKKRVNYYNQLEKNYSLGPKTTQLSEIKIGRKMKTYFFDFFSYARYFNDKVKVNVFFGDIAHVPAEPTIVKSRPLNTDHTNSILLNLNKVRHFLFIKETKDFRDKKNLLVWRSNVTQQHRMRFMEMYFQHPMCNIGQVNTNHNHHWKVERLTIGEQLEYKFILCLEGNDVSSSLKWVMSSNSIAVMPKPSHETWFMEGTLIPDFHYIVIKDDYSDLEEKLQYYIDNTDAALQITRNASLYIEQFKNKKQEDLIALYVLQKYFEKTGQADLSR